MMLNRQMQSPKGHTSGYPHNLFKNIDFISCPYSGEDYKMVAINYWLSTRQHHHSLIQVKFQNNAALDDEKIISVLFEAFSDFGKSDSPPMIFNRHFFDNDETSPTDKYLYGRAGNYQKYEIPKHRYLRNLHYDSVFDKVQFITERTKLSNGQTAYRIGDELHRGNGCHAYALNILEALTDAEYPHPDFGFVIYMPELYV